MVPRLNAGLALASDECVWNGDVGRGENGELGPLLIELRAEDSEARDARLPKKALFSQVGRLTRSVPTVRHGGVVWSAGGLLVS